MNRSESVTKIASALLKAQRKMGGATKGAANPYFKSRYADYGAVLEACKEPLNEEGITILQPHETKDGRNFVVTMLLHESGEWLSSETEVVTAKQNDPQALGSAITYARRYGLQSLLSIPAEDDDGESAMSRTSKSFVSTPAAEQRSAPAASVAAAPVAAAAAPAAAKRSSFKTQAKSEPAKAAAPAAAAEAKPAAQSDELGW
jgi:hypothetical protein